MTNTNREAKTMIKEKIQGAGLPMGYILQELGLKNEATLWKQIENGSIYAEKLRRLCGILHLRREEIEVLLAA